MQSILLWQGVCIASVDYCGFTLWTWTHWISFILCFMVMVTNLTVLTRITVHNSSANRCMISFGHFIVTLWTSDQNDPVYIITITMSTVTTMLAMNTNRTVHHVWPHSIAIDSSSCIRLNVVVES